MHLVAAGSGRVEPSRSESMHGQGIPSLDAFVHTEIRPLSGIADREATCVAVTGGTRAVLSEYKQPDASLSLPIRARLVA